MVRTAICRCGGCAIEVEGEPAANLICHCTYCRRRTGGPCGWTATFREDQVLGRRGDFRVYNSDGTVGRMANSFCSTCGTTLIFTPVDIAGLIGCAGGCFVDDPLDEPTLSASDDLRCAWLRLPDTWQVRTSTMAETARPRQ